MKAKSKIILASCMTIALSASLIAGSTFALFTSESKTNIAITSGKVNVEAKVDATSFQLWSLKDGVQEALEEGATAFVNGGTVQYDANTLALDRVTPGDKVEFDIVVANNSNVTVQYRTAMSVVKNDGLFEGLKISYGEKDSEVVLSGSSVYSEWVKLEAIAGENKTADTVHVIIELPEEAGNEYQDTSCELTYLVEAVQGNAKVYNGVARIEENTYDTIQAAFNAVGANEEITLLRDVTVYESDLTSNYFVAYNGKSKGWTFNGDGHTITSKLSASGTQTLFGIGYSANATVKNLNIVGAAHVVFYVMGSHPFSYENVNISGEYWLAMNHYGDEEIFMKGCTISNTYADKYAGASVWVGNAGILTLENSAIDDIYIAYKQAGNFTDKGVYGRVYMDALSNVGSFGVSEGAVIFGEGAAIHSEMVAYVNIDKPEEHREANYVHPAANEDHYFTVLKNAAAMAQFATDEKYHVVCAEVDENGNWSINSAKGLLALSQYFGIADSGTASKDMTITLNANIDLTGIDWTPIGNATNAFDGTFDGNGKTISNVVVNSSSDYAGFFGVLGVDATVKDFTLSNISVKGANGVGAVVGYGKGTWVGSVAIFPTIQNVKVTGKLTLEGSDFVGGIVGYQHANVIGCTIDVEKGSTITGNSYVGGLVGHSEGVSGTKKLISNNTVKNVTVVGKEYVGGLTGIAQANIEVTGNALENVSIEAMEGAFGVGALIGRVYLDIGGNWNITLTLNVDGNRGSVNVKNVVKSDVLDGLVGVTESNRPAYATFIFTGDNDDLTVTW